MNQLENIVYTVGDLASAKAVHTALLGVEPHTDQPYYVGFAVGGVEIGLRPQSPGSPTGALPHVRVPDLDVALAAVSAAGASVVAPPMQVAPGVRIATVADADGTLLGLIEHTDAASG